MGTMLISLVLLAVLAADPTFDVQTLDGRTVSGRLVALDGTQLKLETVDGPQTFELATLASATRAGAASAVPAKPAVLVELADGSQLPAAEYSVAGGKATIKLASGAVIDVDARRLGWVRFA